MFPDIEKDNITKTLKTLNACDNLPSENNIDKLLSKRVVPGKPLNDPSVYIDSNNIYKNIIQDVENILTHIVIEEE